MTDHTTDEQELRERIARLEAAFERETLLRIESEELLAESEERYRHTLDRSPQLVIEADVQGRITYANPATHELFGYTKEMYGTHITDFVHPEDIDMELQVFARGLAGGRETLLSRVFTRSGELRYVLNNSVPRYRHGKLDGLVIFGMDVTEHKKIQDELVDSEERYRALAEAAQDYIYLIDSDLRLAYVNKAGAGQFRGDPEQLVGKHITELFPGETSERQIQSLRQVLETGESLFVENMYPFPGGDEVWLSARLAPVRNSEGSVAAVLGISRDISQRKQAEKALRESEEKYRSVVELAADGICITRMGRIIYANQAFCNLTACPIEEVVGRMIFDMVAPEERNLAVETYTSRKSDPEAPPSRIVTFLKQGPGRIPVEVLIARIMYQGEVAGHIIVRDISERIRSEQALRESEEKYRSVVELASEGIGITQDYRLVYANPQLAAMTGCPMEQLIGKPYDEFMPAEEMERAREYRAARRGRASEPGRIESRLVKPDNSTINVDVSTVEITYNGRPAGLIMLRDISDRFRSEQALRESEEKYRSVVELANDGIMISCDTHILFANRQLADMIGREPGDLVGRSFTEFMPPERVQELFALYKAPLDTGQPVPKFFETALRHSDGSEISVEISAAIINYQGQRSGLTFVRNISERKRAEAAQELLQQQLMQSQKMEAIGTLAGGMAHDFNNALAVILGTAEIAIRKTAPDDPHFARFHKIIKASERARHLTMKLLTFARKDKLNVQTVSLNVLAEDCIDILKQTVSKKILLETRLAPGRCTVSADPNQLHQALFNICLNACEAMPQGGELVISTQQLHVNELEFPSPDHFTPGEYCCVTVTDTGPGFQQDLCDKIFDPFFTTKKTGTGLGLSITLGIIRSHGGHISANTLPQGGAEFRLFLPHCADEYDIPRMEDMFKDHHGGGEHILIIDDDKDFTELATEALEMAGFKPYVAAPGPRAVETFRKNHNVIDLVVLDMMMPELDGREIFLACREIRPDIKIILCSGFSRDESISELMDMGVNGFLQKPFTVNDLCEKIDDVLQQ